MKQFWQMGIETLHWVRGVGFNVALSSFVVYIRYSAVFIIPVQKSVLFFTQMTAGRMEE